MKFELSEPQVKNLMTMLNRVQTTGYVEANELLAMANIFQNPIKEKDELPTNKKNTK